MKIETIKKTVESRIAKTNNAIETIEMMQNFDYALFLGYRTPKTIENFLRWNAQNI